jgi:flagellar hook-associated protein 2
MSTTSAIFTGTSRFSTDFQNVIARAVGIASLPISQMTSDLASVQSQSKDLDSLDRKLATLLSAAQGLGSAAGSAGLQAAISDPSVVSAVVGDGAMEGNYSIQVEDAGAYAASMSSAAWPGSKGSAQREHAYRLVVGGESYDIAPADDSAGSVAAAINAAAGGKVRATVVDVGRAAAPDYRISLQSTVLGDVPLDIQDGGISLQTQQTQGRLAQYIVNGSGTTVTSDSRTVRISAGLTLNLLASDPGTPVEVNLTRSNSALSGALASFAQAYNAVADALDQERGQSGGALAGQSVVYQAQRALSAIATYSAGGTGGGLPVLGLELGKDGRLAFDSSALAEANLTNPAAVTAFLGSESGGGFLEWTSDTLGALEAPGTGAVKAAQAGLSAQAAALNQRISAKQDQVDQLQQRLQEQMAAADAAIAAMEQQYNYLNGMFQAMAAANQQYK